MLTWSKSWVGINWSLRIAVSVLVNPSLVQSFNFLSITIVLPNIKSGSRKKAKSFLKERESSSFIKIVIIQSTNLEFSTIYNFFKPQSSYTIWNLFTRMSLCTNCFSPIFGTYGTLAPPGYYLNSGGVKMSDDSFPGRNLDTYIIGSQGSSLKF